MSQEFFWEALDKFQQWQLETFPQMGSKQPKNNIEEDEKLKKDMVLAIGEIMKDVVTTLSKGSSPVLRVPRKQIKEDGSIIFGEDLLTLGRASTLKRFTVLLEVLSKVYMLCMSSSVVTRREIYYENIGLCTTQRSVDLAVEDASLMLGVPRRILPVHATGKGLVAGSLYFTNEEGIIISAMDSPQGLLIPSYVWSLTNLQSQAKFVLVVEKDATFQKLLDSAFLTQFPSCILVTGKGYPDVCTRHLLYRLWTELHLPVLALCDADPYGIHIAAVYKFGSMVCEEPELKIDGLGLLGILPSDLMGLNLPPNAIQKLTPGDIGKLASLAANPEISKRSAWVREIELMAKCGHKAEIQALGHISMNFLTSYYLPMKIRTGSWIA